MAELRTYQPGLAALKLDVQGGELDVLRGCWRTLARTSAVLLEVTFVSHYEGDATFPHLDAAMREHGFDRARAIERGVAEDMRLLGAVEPGRLEALYAAAALFITATRFEGFGPPVLEAMARGVPVAGSDLPVLREVAGDAAVWLEPGNPATIGRAITAALGDAERLRTAGRARAERFSWAAAARATADVYERAAAER